MGKAEISENILLLTTTPERATSIAGDLAQESDERGILWFWGTLFRTALSLAWRSFTDAPFRLTGRAIAGAAVQYVNATILYVVIMAIQMDLALITGISVDRAFWPVYVPSHPLSVISSILSSLGAAYLFGRWLVRKVPHRELTVYAMTWAVSQAVWLLAIRNSPSSITDYGPAGNLIMDILTTVGCTIFTLAGIERRRRQGKLSTRMNNFLQKTRMFLLRYGIDLTTHCPGLDSTFGNRQK